jgi:hypothetical protein
MSSQSAPTLPDTSRAIEVNAMFEDAIVEVAHLCSPTAGRVSLTTQGLIGGGAAALAFAFGDFLVALVDVAHIHRAWDAWDGAGKPHNAFVLPQDGALFDLVAVLLLVAGVAALLAGLYRRFSERGPRDFTLGPDGKASFNAPAEYLPVASFPLVHSTGSDFELLFTSRMSGDITFDGRTMSLAQLAQSGRAHASSTVAGAYAWAIPDDARAKIDLGQNTFLIASVPAPRHYETTLQIDWGTQAYTGATGLAVLLFLFMVHSIPADLQSLSLDAFMNDERFAQFTIKPPDEKLNPLPDWLKKKSNDEVGGKGQRAQGAEGRMGKKTSHDKTGIYAIKRPRDHVDPHLAKRLAEEQAQKAGVLGSLKANDGTQVASIFGRETALGSDAENVLSGMVGAEIGQAYGNDGGGVVGSGKGGGGTGEATIGLSRLGSIGKGGGGGDRLGYGRGIGAIGGRRASAPDVVTGTAQVRGSLDKEIIRRVIRRHLSEVKFCYEKELQHQQNLYGRVTTQFTISAGGQVIASLLQSSTLQNPAVEQCIAQAVRRWEFPKPEGGGIVIVSYPFVLKAAGAE